jgi:hypothetical protein
LDCLPVFPPNSGGNAPNSCPAVSKRTFASRSTGSQRRTHPADTTGLCPPADRCEPRISRRSADGGRVRMQRVCRRQLDVVGGAVELLAEPLSSTPHWLRDDPRRQDRRRDPRRHAGLGRRRRSPERWSRAWAERWTSSKGEARHRAHGARRPRRLLHGRQRIHASLDRRISIASWHADRGMSGWPQRTLSAADPRALTRTPCGYADPVGPQR